MARMSSRGSARGLVFAGILILLPVLAVLPVLGLSGTDARGQASGDPASLLAAQREALKPLAYMDGVWRGPAWSITPTGEKHAITQTERIGPFLDGTVKVIEGRGYGADGKVGFNAFGIVSFDPEGKTYSLRSYAMGRSGDFALQPNAAGNGYTWEIPAGPAAKIRYAAVVEGGKWHEVGDRIAAGQDTLRIFEMNLTRVGDTDWPASGAIPME